PGGLVAENNFYQLILSLLMLKNFSMSIKEFCKKISASLLNPGEVQNKKADLRKSLFWRAGANENTTISFSDEVMINGQSLPAGTYGLHMIPSQNEWTVILSKNYWAWGSFNRLSKNNFIDFYIKYIPLFQIKTSRRRYV